MVQSGTAGHTLSVQVVLDGNRVILLDADLLLRLVCGEGVPVSGVLLLEVLHLILQGERLLFIYLVTVVRATRARQRRGYD